MITLSPCNGHSLRGLPLTFVDYFAFGYFALSEIEWKISDVINIQEIVTLVKRWGYDNMNTNKAHKLKPLYFQSKARTKESRNIPWNLL